MYNSALALCDSIARVAIGSGDFKPSVDGAWDRARLIERCAERLAATYGKLPRNVKTTARTSSESTLERINWKEAFSETSPLSTGEQRLAGLVRFYGPFIELALLNGVQFIGPVPHADIIQSLVDWAAAQLAK